MRVTRCGPELEDSSPKRPPPWLPPAEVRVPYVISGAGRSGYDADGSDVESTTSSASEIT